jgi:flagellar basal-body rod protein FlgF
MIKGLYSAVSGMLMNAARQQVLSHNIANLQTPGFKQVLSSVEEFMPTQAVYSPQNTPNSSALDYLGTLGLGSQISQEYIDFTQGAMQDTGNPLDFAIQGKAMFRVQTADGERFTRDGRFIRDANNTLVTVEGYKVLDSGGQEITLPEGEVVLAADGTLSVNGTDVTQLGFGVFDNPESELQHVGGNFYTGPAASTSQDLPQVMQGYLEASNANPSQLMTQLVEVARSYEASQKMVQNQDEMLGRTIASLGRIG